MSFDNHYEHYTVVVFGSATLDFFIETHPKILVESSIKHRNQLMAYPLGAKILVKNLKEFTGGGGTNTAVSFSRLGLKTGFVGKIAKDYPGLRVFQDLKQHNIKFLGDIGNQTGVSLILDAKGHDRTIFTFKGCNDDITKKDVKHFFSHWVYSSTLLGKSLRTFMGLLHTITEYSSLAFNPSEYMIKNNKKQVLKIISKSHFISLNHEEAELVTGEIDFKQQLLAITSLGPELVAITDGPRVVVAFKADKDYYLELKPKKQVIVEATGAGDAFASGMLSGLINHLGIENSLKLGLINSENVIRFFGAKTGLLTKANALRLLSRDKRKMWKITI